MVDGRVIAHPLVLLKVDIPHMEHLSLHWSESLTEFLLEVLVCLIILARYGIEAGKNCAGVYST